MRKIIFLLLLTLLFIISCDYELTQSNYNEVNQEPKPIDFVYLDSTSSEINIWGMSYLLFHVNLENRIIYNLEFYVDGEKASFNWGRRSLNSKNTQYEYSITFNSNEYADGEHNLEIQITQSSGTGSLADIVGAEKVVYSKNWQLHIENSAPEPVIINSIKTENGRLKVQWQMYKKKNFQRYHIIKNYIKPPEKSFQFVKTITDPSDTLFYDDEYLGGYVSYQINIEAANKSTDGIEKEYYLSLPEILKAETLSNGLLKVTWSRCKIDSNFTKYSLRTYRGSNWDELFSSRNINDTSYATNQAEFGESQEYFIEVYNNTPLERRSEPFDCYLGSKMQSFIKAVYVKNNNSIYTLAWDYYLYRYDAETMQVISKIELPKFYLGSDTYPQLAFDISEDGNYCYYSAGGYIYKLNPMTLSEEKKYSTKEITGENAYLEQMNVSNNNIMVYSSKRYNGYGYAYDGFTIVDLNTEKVLKKVKLDYFIDEPQISPNGNLVRIYQDNYRIADDSVTVESVSDGYFYHSIFTPDGQSIIEFCDHVIKIRDIYNLDIIKTINVPFYMGYSLSYDSQTGLFGFICDQKHYLYNLESEKVIKETKLIFGTTNIMFGNSTLYSNNGYYLHQNLE